MADQQPDYLCPTDEVQTQKLAALLGTTPDKLCPGLKNLAIVRILDKSPSNQKFREEMARSSNDFIFPWAQDRLFAHVKSHTNVTAEDVRECWLKFCYGIQYGFEQRPQWDILGRPPFLVGRSDQDMGGTTAVYAQDPNWIVVLNSFALWATTVKQAKSMADRGDAIATQFLEFLNSEEGKHHPGYCEYPLEFRPILSGLEEIRHAHQSNNQALHAKLNLEAKPIYPAGRPQFRHLSEAQKLGFYKNDPWEKDAENSAVEHADGAIKRYKDTMARLTAPLPKTANPFSSTPITLDPVKGWTGQIDKNRSNGSGPSIGGAPTKPKP